MRHAARGACSACEPSDEDANGLGVKGREHGLRRRPAHRRVSRTAQSASHAAASPSRGQRIVNFRRQAQGATVSDLMDDRTVSCVRPTDDVRDPCDGAQDALDALDALEHQMAAAGVPGSPRTADLLQRLRRALNAHATPVHGSAQDRRPDSDCLAAPSVAQSLQGNAGRAQERGMVHALRALLPVMAQLINNLNSTRDPHGRWPGEAIAVAGGAGATRVRRPSVAGGRFDALIAEAAQSHGVDAALIEAVVEQVSGGDAGRVSHDGAVGLLQLRPEAAAMLACRHVESEELQDPRVSLDLGAKYLARLLDQTGSVEDALGAWHAGPDADWRTMPAARAFVEAVMQALPQESWTAWER
jgi:hypothetical protein